MPKVVLLVPSGARAVAGILTPEPGCVHRHQAVLTRAGYLRAPRFVKVTFQVKMMGIRSKVRG